MPTRHYLTATLLADGRVLVAGGQQHDHDGPFHADASILDPSTGTFAPAPPIAIARGWHSAIRLQDGRVLIVGGETDDERTHYLAGAAEIFDPTRGRWARAGRLSVPRLHPALAFLPDGRLMAAGGYVVPEGDFAAVDAFDPRSGRWSALPDMPRARHARALALADGRILVTGSAEESSGERVGSMDVFDPARRSWQTIEAGAGRYAEVAVGLDDGRVLIVGETDGPDRAYAELRDAALGNPAPAPAPPLGSGDLFDLVLAGAGTRVLAVGQQGVFTWSPGDAAWREVARLARPRFNFAALLVADGRAIAIVGGSESGPGLPAVPEVEICALPGP